MLEVLVNKLKALGEDVDYMMLSNEMCVTINDFEGFDENWEEVDREYNEEAVEEFITWLEDNAYQEEGDYYKYYYLEGVVVCVGYASFDI